MLIQRAVESLDRRRILGVVLNRVAEMNMAYKYLGLLPREHQLNPDMTPKSLRTTIVGCGAVAQRLYRNLSSTSEAGPSAGRCAGGSRP